MGQLMRIQRDCAEINAQNNVSGALFYDGENFFQVLEGNYHTLMATYARICRDPRHEGCKQLISFAMHQRRFEGTPLKVVNAIANPGIAERIVPHLADPSREGVERRINTLAYA